MSLFGVPLFVVGFEGLHKESRNPFWGTPSFLLVFRDSKRSPRNFERSSPPSSRRLEVGSWDRKVKDCESLAPGPSRRAFGEVGMVFTAPWTSYSWLGFFWGPRVVVFGGPRE